MLCLNLFTKIELFISEYYFPKVHEFYTAVKEQY
jgi:hypothetical protein